MAKRKELREKAAEEKLMGEVKSALAFLMAKSNGICETGGMGANKPMERDREAELPANTSVIAKGSKPLYIWDEDNDTALKVKIDYNREVEFIKSQTPGEHASSEGALLFNVYRDPEGRKVVEVEARGEVDSCGEATTTIHVLSLDKTVIIENFSSHALTRESYELMRDHGLTHRIEIIRDEQDEPILLLEDRIHPDGSTTTFTMEEGLREMPAKTSRIRNYKRMVGCLRLVEDLEEVMPA